MPATELDQRTGLTYRPDSDDRTVIGEVRREYSGLDCDGQVCVDIGAHIGTFPRLVAPTAAKVACYEPERSNFDLLLANTAGQAHVVPVPCAVGGESGDVVLYVNDGKGQSMHSTMTVGRKTPTTVDQVAIEEVLAEWTPTVLKIDAEGAEWAMLSVLCELPEHVRQLGIEMHLKVGRRRLGGSDALMLGRLLHKSLTDDQGFDPVRPPSLDDGTWTTVACYRR